MAGLRNFKDMARTPEEKKEQYERNSVPTPVSEMPDYPYGLCISLDQDDLEKLGIDCDFDADDVIHIAAFARVTSVNKSMVDGQERCRLELQIEQLAMEDESTEEGDY